MAKAERGTSRELRLLQKDPCFEESRNVKRSEFKCNECSLSFHRKTSYDSHMTVNHKKKEEMAEIWRQLDKPDAVNVVLKPKKPDKTQIVKTDLKHKIVVGLDGKVVKKYKAGIVELRKKVNSTNASTIVKSSNVQMVTPSTSGHKPLNTGAPKSVLPLPFDKKGIQCLNCKYYYKNSFEFGVHTTRVEHRVPCQICFQSFENQCYLKRHQRMAHPHVCNMCDKLFSTEQHLDLHRKVSHRMIYQLKADNQSQKMSTVGNKSKNKQIATIVISDPDEDHSSQKRPNQAFAANAPSLSTKHKLCAKDMMQSLASIAKSNDNKDPFTNMLSVMLEKPPIRTAPPVIYTSKPVISMQGNQVASVTKPVQSVQPKLITVSSTPTVGTSTAISPFLGQHVTSTVYSNLRPKGSFNLGKQVERVNLACRLAQHKQSLELKRLLRRHPQYKINDKDLKFKIPLGNLSEEFDECPLFPTEADIKVRTSNYTISPLSLIDDTDHLESLSFTNNAIHRMFNDAVDSCVLQEAWKLTHSSNIRRRCREVTSYSLKQKQECILDLHVQLLAIRNAAQTIVNKALVKHITELKQAGKQMSGTSEVKNDQDKPSNCKVGDQATRVTVLKPESSHDTCHDQNGKITKSEHSEVIDANDTNRLSETKQSSQQNQPQTPDELVKSDVTGDKKEIKCNQIMESRSETVVDEDKLNQSKTDNQKECATFSSKCVSNDSPKGQNDNSVDVGTKDSIQKMTEVNIEKNCVEKNKDKSVNGISLLSEEIGKQNEEIVVDKQCPIEVVTEEKAGEDMDVDKSLCKHDVNGVLLDDSITSEKNKEEVKESIVCEQADKQECHSKANSLDVVTVKQGDVETPSKMEVNVEGTSDENAVNKNVVKGQSNKDVGEALLQADSTPIIQEKETFQVTSLNSNREVSVVPNDKDNRKTDIVPCTKSIAKLNNEQASEMERLDKLQALTDELMKAIPATKSGETIYISEVQISSEYCGLIGKGHYNGMDFRWIVQFARPYINTLMTHRKKQFTNGEGYGNGNQSKTQVTEAAAATTTICEQNSTTVGSAVSGVNVTSSQTSAFPVENVTAVFNAEEFPTPSISQVASMPSLPGYPVNPVQPIAATPVALPQSTVAPQSPVSVPIVSAKSPDSSSIILSQPSVTTLQVLPVDRPIKSALTTLTSIVPTVQPVKTNIFLSQGIKPVQSPAIVGGLNLSSFCQNATVCVPTLIDGNTGSQITSIPHINEKQKEFRPLLPKSSPGFLTLANNNIAVMHQDILLQSCGYNQQQLYTLTATNPLTNTGAIVPTTRDSNQLPSETRTGSIPMIRDCMEEPKKKVFYRLDDCLDFEAGEIALFNNDIQNGKIPKHHQKKLFKCKVCEVQGSEKTTNDNNTFLNSLYSIKKIYITGHLSKDIYQKFIPLTQILKCSGIQIHIKRTYTFLVEALLKQAQLAPLRDVDRIHTLLLDILNKSTKVKNNTKLVKHDSESTTTTGSKKTTSDDERIKTCALKICLTDLKLPKNQSTVLVSEKKNAENKHVGFVIKNKTGASFEKDVLTTSHVTIKRSNFRNKQDKIETLEIRDISKKSKIKGENSTTETKWGDCASSNSSQHKPRKQQLRTDMKGLEENKTSQQCNLFITPDETDPEIEFLSPPMKRRKKTGH